METKKVAKEYLQKDILRTIFQMWYSFYTTEIGKERKAAIEDMRFERDGWLHIEPWEIWLELTEHPENEDDRTIWYQDMHGIWKKAEVNDHSIKIPATAFHIEYEQQWLGEIHFTCNLGFVAEKKEGSKKKNDMLTGWKAFAENTGYRVTDKYIKKTGGKGKMVKKIENRNIDVTKARGELEEDLLEYVYRTWRQGRQITSKEYAREVNITGYEAAGLVRSLVKKGFLCEPENGHLELSDKGKLEGMECLARHEKLTQFFQMVSGMDQKRAQEDACRVEHYISPEGLKGIENFLQYGDVYDRIYDDMDLYTFYEDGDFPMAFGLYEPERRNPRFLATEYEKLEHSVILRVKKVPELLPAQDKKDESIGCVWYRRDEEWIQAKEEKGVYQLPTDIFTYTANTGIPVTEAVAIIAITRFEQKPLPIDYRELNIHVW